MMQLGATGQPTVGDLAASIFCREFVPAYEPVVHLGSGSVLGWEVHGRWIHPTRGLLPASEYTARAEQTGLADPIDEIVVDRAFRRFRRWSAGRLEQPGPWLAVATPGRRLTRTTFREWFLPLLGTYSIPPARVMLDISHLSPVSMAEAVETLGWWRELGGSAAIDATALADASLGWSRVAVDTVKLSAQVVDEVADRGAGESLAAHLIEDASLSGLRVIAEGLHTEEQRNVLVRLGCDAARGPLVAEPEPELSRPALALCAG